MVLLTPRKRSTRLNKENDKENVTPNREARKTPKKRVHSNQQENSSPPKRLHEALTEINKTVEVQNELVSPIKLQRFSKSCSTKSPQWVNVKNCQDISNNDQNINSKEDKFLSPIKPFSICLEKCDEIIKSPQARKLVQSLDSRLRKLSLTSPVKNISNNAPSSPYQLVCQALSCSSSKLVCRDSQIKEMKDFLEDKLSTGGGAGAMYISGAPGTGKTACLNHILSSIPTLSKLKAHWVNCMGVQSSVGVFSRIAKEFNIEVTSNECKTKRSIEKYFTSAKKTIILVLDEVDQLETKDQEVLYTIFEWPALKNSKLLLFAIANRLDLTERVLPRLNTSTCAPCRLHFPPYNKTEIVTIITDRLNETGCTWSEVIKPVAIHLLSGKVASVAGDVRRALEVCRRAVENCHTKAKIAGNSDATPAVDAGTILKLFNEVYGSRIVTALTEAPNTLPMQQKMLLSTLLLVKKHAKVKEVTIGKLQEIYNNVCSNRKIPCADGAEFQSLTSLLQTRCMITISRNKDARMAKVTLLLDSDEIEKVLADSRLLYQVLEDREALGKAAKPIKKTL